MKQLREFAQKTPEFDKANAKVVGVSVDDDAHARKVWDEVSKHQITILSDPGAQVIRAYGLLHPQGHGGEDIALRATIIIDERGREVYRKVSTSVVDTRTPEEILAALR